jgi:hypothetical protein
VANLNKKTAFATSKDNPHLSLDKPGIRGSATYERTMFFNTVLTVIGLGYYIASVVEIRYQQVT